MVAVSGGADSVVLLHLLWQFAKTARLELFVAHANHRLRDAADADELFVRNLAAGLGLRCFTDCLPVREEMACTRESVEMAARRLRHVFLARIATENGAGHIALAHHADDQAELFFLRLLRGAGGEGLGGMKRSSRSPADPGIRLIRPLLEFGKVELLAYAEANRLEFREDASNRDRDILRNRIRHELLPLLAGEYSPGIREHVRRTGELAADEADYTRRAADRWLKAGRRGAFSRLHIAVQRAVIRRQLWDLGHPGDFELIERLRLGTVAVTVSAGGRFRRKESGLVAIAESSAPASFSPESHAVDLTKAKGRVDFDGVSLRWQIESQSDRKGLRPDQPGEERLDAARVGRLLRLRHWQPGDRFKPLGFKQPTKLQNLFVNRKVPAALRRQLLVAECESGELCWVEGLPPGESFKLTSATRWTLVLGWQRGLAG